MKLLRRWSRTLRFKFIVTALCVQLAALALLTWVSLETTDEAMRDQAHSHIHGMAPLINASLAGPVLEEDLAVLKERVDQIADSNHFPYVLITDVRGQTILERGTPAAAAHHAPAPHSHPAAPLEHLSLQEPRITLQVDSLVVGHATIQVDDGLMNHALARLQTSGISIAGIAAGLTLVLLVLTGTVLTQGLTRVTQAAQQLADGNLGIRVKADGDDELSNVGKAFNAMAESLSQQRTDLQARGQRIQLLMDSTAEAICGIDPAGFCTFANRASLRMLNLCEEGELLGRNLLELLQIPGKLARLVAEGRPCHSDELSFDAPEDGHISLECWSHPIIDHGLVAGAVVTILDISSRRRAESSLRDSEARYRLLVENQTDLVVKVDRDGQFLFVSPSYCETFGRPADQLLGHSFMPLVHEDDRAQTARAMQDLYRPPFECTLEQRAKTTQGWRWFSWADKAMLDENGQVTAIVGVGRDITGRKLAESALRASEAKLRAIVDNSPTLIMMKDVDGQVSLMNQSSVSSANLKDIDIESVVEKLTALFDGEAGSITEHGHAIGKSAAEFGEYEVVFRRSDGQQVIYSAVAFPLYDENDAPLGTGVMALDVTEKRQMHDALMKSEERFNLAVKGSTDGIWDWNLHTDEIYLSERFKELLGYRPDELGSIWTGWEQWVHEDDVTRVSQAIGEHLSAHTPCQFECRLRCKSGVHRWFLIRGQAVLGPTGAAARMAGSITDVTYRRETEAQIKKMAYYDELTSLPNRRLVLEELGRRLDAAQNHGETEAVVFLDLDHFKKINDSLGHHFGDALLKRVGERLRAEVRSDDMVGRLGGDEFVVLLSDLGGIHAAAQVAARRVTDNLMRALAQPYDLDGHLYHVTPSMGVILYPDGSETVEDVMKRADTALYASKNDGRNTVRFYQPEMQLAVDSRLTIEKDLRLAIERDELELYYQPQYRGTAGRLIGAEALLRWSHPSRGFISPADFIPVAEDSGLIIPLGRWVLASVVNKIKAWDEQGLLGQDLAIAANLSARQFFERSLVMEISQLLRNQEVPGRRLKLELTESTLMHNIEEAIGKIELLKKMDIGFALDDFGTGYSSLSYLKTLPVDELKIDRSFVRDIPADANDAAITETIIAMAAHLKLLVVAEGVETIEQLEFLQQQGCNTYQGYYFSRPLPCDEFEHLLHRNAIGSASEPTMLGSGNGIASK